MTPRGLKICLGVVFGLLILGYGVFRFYDFLSGPQIVVISPKDGESTSTDVIMVNGSVENAVTLSIDGSAVSPDQNGSFNDTLLLPAGLSILSLEATDRFGAPAYARVDAPAE